MGRKRFKRKHRSKTRRALLVVFLLTTFVLAIIAVIARRDSGLSGGGEWVVPAIGVAVSLSGIFAWVILVKANR